MNRFKFMENGHKMHFASRDTFLGHLDRCVSVCISVSKQKVWKHKVTWVHKCPRYIESRYSWSFLVEMTTFLSHFEYRLFVGTNDTLYLLLKHQKVGCQFRTRKKKPFSLCKMLKKYLEVYLILCKFHEKNVQSLPNHFKCIFLCSTFQMYVSWLRKTPPMLFVSSKI